MRDRRHSAHAGCRSAHPATVTDTPTRPYSYGRADELPSTSTQEVHPMTSSEIRPDPGQPTNDAYSRMDADPRFVELRRRFRNFVFPMTVAFLAWYLLYVLLSAFGRGFMDAKVVGNLNVAFFFGILQFVSTFGIAWLYSRYADRRLDPLSSELHDELGGRR